MIEITLRVKSPAAARTLAEMLREAAAAEADRGQSRHWRGAARRLEDAVRPIRYTPRVRRPRHCEIDDEAVRRVIRGEHPLPILTRDEARLACWHLTVRGSSAAEIAERVKVAARTVARWRAEDFGASK